MGWGLFGRKQVDMKKNILLILIVSAFLIVSCASSVSEPVSDEPDMDRTTEGRGALAKNPELCDQVPRSRRDTCYSDFVGSKEYLHLCNKIRDNLLEKACYSRVGINENDVSICEMKSTKGTLDYCYYGVAGKTLNVKLCPKISVKDDNSKADQIGCYSNVAAGLRDTSICELFEGNRDQCYYRLSQSQDPVFACEKINEQKKKDECLLRSAETLDDCNEIQNIIPKSACYGTMAGILGDPSLCELVYDKLGFYYVDKCYLRTVKMTGKKEFCKEIYRAEIRARCLEDASVCDEIDRQDNKKWCIQEVERDKKSDQICDLSASNERERNICYGRVY